MCKALSHANAKGKGIDSEGWVGNQVFRLVKEPKKRKETKERLMMLICSTRSLMPLKLIGITRLTRLRPKKPTRSLWPLRLLRLARPTRLT